MFSLKPTVPILGPHAVGSTEFEIPISEIDTQTSPPDPAVSTVKFRLYYPTDSPSKGTVPWVPAPQKQWTEAFGRFLGSSLGFSSIVNPLLSYATYFTIPAVPNASLVQARTPYPLLVFSHGLAGNCNTYSSLCGSLASCGIIVVAPEHRDGSAVVSMLRDATGNIASEINYRKYAHTATADVFNARNTQLRTRMWELDLIYTVLGKLNSGQELSNYALVGTKATAPTLASQMDMAPGRVTWAGHSFGACTVTQFVKSIYYRASLPSLAGTAHEHDPAYQPLYTPRSGSALINQVTPSSPVALLDVWTMPFRAPSAQWLWEKPMPCYDIAASQSRHNTGPTTVSVMSTEFHVWTDLLNRTLALLSADPVKSAQQQASSRSPKTPKLDESLLKTPTFATPPNKHDPTDDDKAADYDNDLLPPASLPFDEESVQTVPVDRSATSTPLSTTSTVSSTSSSSSYLQDSIAASAATSTTSLSPSITAKPTRSTPNPPITTTPTHHTAVVKLFHIPQTAHLSQSDFGVLFPTLTRLLNKARDPTGCIELNVRAVTQAMRNAGVRGVRRVDEARVRATRQEEDKAAAAARRTKAAAAAGGWLGGWFASSTPAPAASSSAAAATGEEKVDQDVDMNEDDILNAGHRLVPGADQKKADASKGLERWVELPLPDVR